MYASEWTRAHLWVSIHAPVRRLRAHAAFACAHAGLVASLHPGKRRLAISPHPGECRAPHPSTTSPSCGVARAAHRGTAELARAMAGRRTPQQDAARWPACRACSSHPLPFSTLGVLPASVHGIRTPTRSLLVLAAPSPHALPGRKSDGYGLRTVWRRRSGRLMRQDRQRSGREISYFFITVLPVLPTMDRQTNGQEIFLFLLCCQRTPTTVFVGKFLNAPATVFLRRRDGTVIRIVAKK